MKKLAPVDRLIWLDGALVPWENATVHVLSHGLQRGTLVFDYLRVTNTRRGQAIFRMDLHVQRLLRSCELIDLPISLDSQHISAAIGEAVLANPGCTAVKISAYYASLEADLVPIDRRVSIAIAAYDPVRDLLGHLPGPPRAAPSNIRLRLEQKVRQRRDDIVPPQAKVSANYTSTVSAKARAQREGFDEIILLDEDGLIAEAPTANIFLVDDLGHLITPPLVRVLGGVTRQSILELGAAQGIPVCEEPIAPGQLFAAAEVFLTGSSVDLLPAESLDGRTIGQVCPGPISSALKKLLSRVMIGDDPNFRHWLSYPNSEA